MVYMLLLYYLLVEFRGFSVSINMAPLLFSSGFPVISGHNFSSGRFIRSAINRKIHIGWLLLLAFSVLVFSFDFHAVWIVYDLIAAGLLFLFLLSRKGKVAWFQLFILSVTIVYFILITLINGHYLMSILSMWDTFKHLIYITLLVRMAKVDSLVRNTRLIKSLYVIIAFAFFIQMIVVSIQYGRGEMFDNIAGTFGDGGSHAVGYISLLFICAAFVFRNVTLIVCSIIVAVLMNMAAENAGFFVLLALLTLVLFALHGAAIFRHIYICFAFFILVLMIGWMLSFSVYSDLAFGSVIMGRLVDLLAIHNYGDSLESVGRSTSLFMASQLGGWLGSGPGAYSNIYLLEGYRSHDVGGLQINICEVSHLIAESGYIGLVLVMATYISFVASFFDRWLMRVLAACFLVVCLFYSALLMNESQAFMFILMLFFLSLAEKRKRTPHIIS